MTKTIFENYRDNAYKTREINNYRDIVYSCNELYNIKTAFKIKTKDGIENISYRKLYFDYKYLCTALIDMGYTNKRIGIVGKNSYYWSLVYLAATTVGVSVPLDCELHGEDIMNFLIQGECSLLFSDKKCLEKIVDLNASNIETICTEEYEYCTFIEELIEHGKQCYENGFTYIDTVEIDAEAMSILIFTSGTTGSSKGVCLSPRNICANIMSAGKGIKIDSHDTVLSILPLHHTFECTLGFLFVLYSGSCITYCDGLMSILKNMKEYHPTGLIVVPAMLEFFVRRIKASIIDSCPQKYKSIFMENSLSDGMKLIPKVVALAIKKLILSFFGGKLRLVFVGAAAIDPSVIKDFASIGVNVYQGYGLTECSPLVAFNNPFCNRVEASGYPTLDVEVVIDNPNDDGIGEILVKGDNVMLGYYNDEAATNACLKDGYFHTGDLGYIDDDGFLYIKGRIKNVIVTKNGKNIFPEELEKKLSDHEEIAEIIILGEEHPEKDVVVKAKIFPNADKIKKKLGYIPDDETVKKIISKIVEDYNLSVPSYKHIKKVEILAHELEKTSTRKIKRYGDNVN